MGKQFDLQPTQTMKDEDAFKLEKAIRTSGLNDITADVILKLLASMEINYNKQAAANLLITFLEGGEHTLICRECGKSGHAVKR